MQNQCKSPARFRSFGTGSLTFGYFLERIVTATYFSKCFHDFYGYPPGEVRKRFVSKPGSGKNLDHIGKPENQIKSIAVLPFDNYTNDNSQEFLVFEMHDALIGEIGQLGTNRVVSKTSVLTYLDSDKTIKEIASELDVDAIVEASVLFVNEKIKIQLKLYSIFMTITQKNVSFLQFTQG